MGFGDNWGGGYVIWDTEEKEKLAHKRMEIENERMRIENERMKLLLLGKKLDIENTPKKEKQLPKSPMARLLTLE